MFACIHVCDRSVPSEELLQIAGEFSPSVEQTSPDTVVFSIDPLRGMLGSPYQIASEICRTGHKYKIKANLAISSNPDSAILLARNFMGVTLVTPGEEHLRLAGVPLAALLSPENEGDESLFEILYRWGLKTCEDLGALPESGIVERLGPRGVYLRNLALGKIQRPLRIAAPETNYTERIELEHPLELLEPLLFLLGRGLNVLCSRLRSQARAARSLVARIQLERKPQYQCELEFPVPLAESHTMLKLLQLHLEKHPPEGPVLAFELRINPVEPRRVQRGIFLPPTPAPDKLQVTLARIGAMVGKENVGTPVLLDTYRPDAFQMTTLNANTEPNAPAPQTQFENPATQKMLHLAIRIFRPALAAQVKVSNASPQIVRARGVKGKVLNCAGPWKTSGEWWTSTSWTHEEWDVALDDGALYRIYLEMQTREWFVHGMYD